MVFNSIEFILLLLVVFVAYYAPGSGRQQIPVLVAASFFFYGYHDPSLLFLLVFSVLLNATLSYWLLKDLPVGRQKCLAATGIVVNLSLLAFFKYATLMVSTLGHFLSDGEFGRFLLGIPLPIGISFYTFHSISLLVDILRAKNKPNAPRLVTCTSYWGHLVNTTLYISFFPQLVSGPIVKANQMYPQFSRKYFKDIPWEFVFRRLVLGYFLKMVVADNLKEVTALIVYPHFLQLSSVNLVSLLFAFSVQIFADFAGYSIIAVGLAALFGYKFPDNFNLPYKSASVTEFWRRWHISLSSWLRDYLYISLGGNRKGTLRTYGNLFIVMFLGGLWHGAAWSYAMWGTWHGLALAIERPFLKDKPLRPSPGFWLYVRGAVVFVFVSFAWLLFKLPNFHDVLLYVNALCTNHALKPNIPQLVVIPCYVLPVAIYHFYENLPLFLAHHSRPLLYALMLLGILFCSGTPGTFIYFQF